MIAVSRGRWGHKGHKDHKAFRAHKVSKARKVSVVNKDHKDHKVGRVKTVKRANAEKWDQEAPLVRLGHKDQKEIRATREIWVLWAQKEKKVIWLSPPIIL